MPYQKTCKVCGKEFVASRYDAILCSDTCRKTRQRQYSSQGLPSGRKLKNCKICGKKFQAKHRNACNCSPACRKIRLKQLRQQNYLRNREKCIASAMDWQKRNPEKDQEYHRQHTNSPKYKQWRERNREKIREQVRENVRRWREKNPEGYKEINRRYARRKRARKLLLTILGGQSDGD